MTTTDFFPSVVDTTAPRKTRPRTLLIQSALFGGKNVTKEVAGMVVDNTLSIGTDFDMVKAFGDPQYGIPKVLEIDYQWLNPTGDAQAAAQPECHSASYQERYSRLWQPVFISDSVKEDEEDPAALSSTIRVVAPGYREPQNVSDPDSLNETRNHVPTMPRVIEEYDPSPSLQQRPLSLPHLILL